MAQCFLKIAVVYLFLGALLGITMGIFQNFALPPFMVGLSFFLTGHASAMGLVVVTALLVLIGLGLFMVNVLANVTAIA